MTINQQYSTRNQEEKALFNHFQMFDDLYDVIFEITEGDNVRKQQMQAPRIIIEQQFLQLMQQAVNVQIPVKIKLSRTEQIYDNFDQKFIEQENNITFMNNTYIQLKGQD